MDQLLQTLRRNHESGLLDEQHLRHVECRIHGHEGWVDTSFPGIKEWAKPLKQWAKPLKQWKMAGQIQADLRRELVTRTIACIRCGAEEILKSHPTNLSYVTTSTSSTDEIFTVAIANAHNTSHLDTTPPGFQQPYTWHPTKARHWQTPKRKVKQRSAKKARKRNRK